MFEAQGLVMSEVEISTSVADSCRRWADRAAVTHRGRTWTYAELDEKIRALTSAYRELGIARGDRVVCQLPPSSEHIVALAAAWAHGAVHVGAHPDLTGPELAAVVEQSGATALLFQPRGVHSDALAPLDAVRAAHPSLRIIVNGEKPQSGEHALSDLLTTCNEKEPTSSQPSVGDGPAVLMRTSGTTGLPKAVIETLPALWGKVRFFAENMRPTPDDVHLMYLPVSHAFGMKLSLTALATGGRLVLLDRFSPEQALQAIGNERATILPGTPTHFALLLRTLDPNRHHVETLRWTASAAAPFPSPLVDEVYSELGVEIMHVYGCSEGFVTLTTDREEIRMGSAGSRVFEGPPGTPPDGSMAVLDFERNVALPRGEIGEIAYGARQPVRYWNEPPVASDGWYRTGDVGWIDEHGRLFVRGRLKELVNRGGLKVPCAEVESALRTLPDILDCAVIASPDPILGEAICACIVPTAGSATDLADVRGRLSDFLARHKLPDELCVLEEIPHTSVGKIDRAALVERMAGLPRTRLRPVAPLPPAPAATRFLH